MSNQDQPQTFEEATTSNAPMADTEVSAQELYNITKAAYKDALLSVNDPTTERLKLLADVTKLAQKEEQMRRDDKNAEMDREAYGHATLAAIHERKTQKARESMLNRHKDKETNMVVPIAAVPDFTGEDFELSTDMPDEHYNPADFEK